jgi:lipoate-protein ligase B
MYWIDLGYMDYEKSLETQRIIVEKRLADELPDILLTVEHPHVYTVGKRGKLEDVPQMTIPVVRVERGGSVTYHGPGQLVAYPIIKLDETQMDVHQLVNMLEEVGICLLKEYNVVAERAAGKPGVWVEGKKIASIGLAIKNWVTYHGIAINVNVDLRYFQAIKPCGFSPDLITSLKEILGREVSMSEVKQKFIQCFAKIFSVKLVEKTMDAVQI